jgi:hypothetical protein
MQQLSPLPSVFELRTDNRPQIVSFDSSQEFSLEHWLELCRLVEQPDYEAERYLFDDACLRIS